MQDLQLDEMNVVHRDEQDDYVEEELPRGGNGRSRARMLKKAEAHRFAILIVNQGLMNM